LGVDRLEPGGGSKWGKQTSLRRYDPQRRGAENIDDSVNDGPLYRDKKKKEEVIQPRCERDTTNTEN